MNKPKERHSFINTPLTQYKHIIDSYWEEFDKVVEEYQKDTMSVSDIDPRTVKIIRNLKGIETWKSNLFILSLHFHKLKDFAKALNIKETSLSVYISKIRKEIKC